jgi:hypothetical protein
MHRPWNPLPVLALTCLAVTAPGLHAAPAPAPEALAACAALVDDGHRLACYDAVVRVRAPAPVASPTPAGTVSPAAGLSGFGTVTPVPHALDGPSNISVRVTGHLDGLRKGVQFKLDNGQVWECTDDLVYHYTADNPAATIRRNAAGNKYWIILQGAAFEVPVVRLQ